MKICIKCGEKIPYSIKIDGITRSLTKRKFCVKCSPFGSHNTRDITQRKETYNCVQCGCILQNRRRRYCQNCIKSNARYKLKSKIMEIVGNSCWRCGFSCGEQSMYILQFHHVDGITKEFGISVLVSKTANIDTIKVEMRKCVLLCPNCHSMCHHTEIISSDEINKLHIDKWNSIDGVSDNR